MCASVLAVKAPAAGRTYALTPQILDHLLDGHKLLYPVQSGLAFGYAYPQGLQDQLRPIQFRHATPLFAALGEAHNFHPEGHTRHHRMRSSRRARRWLASSKLKRPGSSGPQSCRR